MNCFKLFRNSLYVFTFLFLFFILISCGDDDHDNKSTVSTNAESEYLYGVIATGSPIKSGFVFIKGSNNIEKKTEISSNGEYRIDINNLAEPYKLKAISGEMDSVLYSYSHRYGNANITPLTSLVVFEANGHKSLNAFYNSSETLSSNDLENADLIVKSNLAPYIYYAGLSYNEFNIISDAFKPNHFGHDALLDRLKIEVMDTNNIVIKDVLTNEDVEYKSEIKNADSYVDESNFSRRIIKKISISTKDAETFMSQIIDDLIDQKIIEYHYNMHNKNPAIFVLQDGAKSILTSKVISLFKQIIIENTHLVGLTEGDKEFITEIDNMLFETSILDPYINMYLGKPATGGAELRLMKAFSKSRVGIWLDNPQQAADDIHSFINNKYLTSFNCYMQEFANGIISMLPINMPDDPDICSSQFYDETNREFIIINSFPINNSQVDISKDFDFYIMLNKPVKNIHEVNLYKYYESTYEIVDECGYEILDQGKKILIIPNTYLDFSKSYYLKIHIDSNDGNHILSSIKFHTTENEIEKPHASEQTGTYSTIFFVELYIPNNSDFQIFYTLDGTKPNKNSTLYSSEFLIDKDTILKAITYSEGRYSELSTYEYQFSGKPIISLSEDLVDFGIQKNTSNMTRSLTIENDGTLELYIYDIEIDNDNFILTDDNSCVDNFIFQQESCTFFISYVPNNFGRQNANLSIISNDTTFGNEKIKITGAIVNESFFNNLTWYQIHNEPVSWNEAYSICNDLDLYLPSKNQITQSIYSNLSFFLSNGNNTFWTSTQSTLNDLYIYVEFDDAGNLISYGVNSRKKSRALGNISFRCVKEKDTSSNNNNNNLHFKLEELVKNRIILDSGLSFYFPSENSYYDAHTSSETWKSRTGLWKLVNGKIVMDVIIEPEVIVITLLSRENENSLLNAQIEINDYGNIYKAIITYTDKVFD